MLSLGRILISDLVANLLMIMYSLPGMILLYLAMPFVYTGVFSDNAGNVQEISCVLVWNCM